MLSAIALLPQNNTRPLPMSILGRASSFGGRLQQPMAPSAPPQRLPSPRVHESDLRLPVASLIVVPATGQRGCYWLELRSRWIRKLRARVLPRWHDGVRRWSVPPLLS